MGRLHQLHAEAGQSPWLDNLRRDWIDSGEIERWVERGVRGITSNPSIFQKAITAGTAYDEQFADLLASNTPIEDAYWDLVVHDIRAALAVLRPVYDGSNGEDGFVSIEVDPGLAHDEEGTAASARHLHELIAEPNLYVKIPGTAEGVGAIEQMVAEGRNINVTLIFSLERYGDIIEAYLSGLERREGDISQVTGVASFFISRVDTEIDRRLDTIGTPEALALRGKGAVAQGQLAYELFRRRFSGSRWDALAGRGARFQRPLWASTSTKNPAYRDTLYVDELIGPDTVNTLPEPTLEAFEDHGRIARTIDADTDAAHRTWEAIGALVDLDDVGRTLEDEGVTAFSKAIDDLFASLREKAELLRS
ncbi:MAG: transaldolase [Microthrixaceae bacterium]|nr:transaldolase [Microthrixaceae bacterium]